MGRKQVLLVEPDSILARNYIIGLRSSGYKTIHASTGQMAITSVDTILPDCVVLELLLANHNGFEFLYEFRSYIDLQLIPVIILSFVPQSDVGLTPRQYRNLKIVNYLYKPKTSVDDLVSAVDKAMS